MAEVVCNNTRMRASLRALRESLKIYLHKDHPGQLQAMLSFSETKRHGYATSPAVCLLVVDLMLS